MLSGNIRDDFPGLGEAVWLNAAGLGIAPACALRAVRDHLDLLESGLRGRSWPEFHAAFEAPVERACREVATLLGASTEEVALAGDTSSGLHRAIDAIPFREGDNVVVGDLEYPQVGLAARSAERCHGVEVRVVPNRRGRLELDEYARAADGRTRAFLVSSVQWVTGQRLDLGAFSQLAADRDAFLVVDAIQELGARRIDSSSLRVDFLAAGAYKWLNAPFGVGLFYARRKTHERGLRERPLGLLGLEPPEGGWEDYYESPDVEPLPDRPPVADARRFGPQGTPNRMGSAGLAASLAYRNGLNDDEATAHVLELGGLCLEALAERGARILTPREDRERAGIVTFSFADDPQEARQLREFLAGRQVHVSSRWCSGVGGVRVAFHVFNDRGDLEALLAGIDAFRRGGP